MQSLMLFTWLLSMYMLDKKKDEFTIEGLLSVCYIYMTFYNGISGAVIQSHSCPDLPVHCCL